MANIYSEMGRFLQESFTIDNTFKKSMKKSSKLLKEDFATKSRKGKALKEDYETDVDLPYDPDAPYNVDVDLPYDSSADYNAYVDLADVLGWLSEHETAYEDCKRHFGMDFDDPDFDEEITVHDLEEWISEHEGLWKDYLNYFNIPDPYLDESLKEDFSDARPAATKIFNFIEMGADPADILDELLRFLPDGALVDFADYYGENFLGIGDDWE